MTTLISSTIKTLALCFIALICLTLTQVEARADEITVSGTTTAVISGNPSGLTFTNGSFTATTVNNRAAVGGQANPSGGGDNLGRLSLAATNANYNNTITLTVTFTAPQGINSGNNPATYTATITGSVLSNGNGGVDVIFGEIPQTFSFNDGTNSGTFTLLVRNISINPGQTVSITGSMTGSQTAIPEPATLILLGTGLTGVAARIRKRRKNANAASIS